MKKAIEFIPAIVSKWPKESQRRLVEEIKKAQKVSTTSGEEKTRD